MTDSKLFRWFADGVTIDGKHYAINDDIIDAMYAGAKVPFRAPKEEVSQIIRQLTTTHLNRAFVRME